MTIAILHPGIRVSRRAGIGVLLLGAVSGCAPLSLLRPEPPSVRVIGVRPLNLSLTRQELEFRLAISNPNGFELPLRSLDFVATLGDERVADGRSLERVTVPAHGDAELAVTVVTGIDRVFGHLRRLLERPADGLDYAVTGFVRLVGWPRRIPFDADGRLDPLVDADRPDIR